MNKELNVVTVLIEEAGGPIEFKVQISKCGSLRWNVGRYLVSGQPCVRLSLEFGKRLRDAINLLHEQSSD